MPKRNASIKEYISCLCAEEDEILLSARRLAKKEKLPDIAISASVGKLLYCLAKIHRPQRILEVGTLAGYSAIWLARALSDGGKLISLEIVPHHVDVAKKNIRAAGLEDKIEIREGPANLLLDQMIQDGESLFDLIFIDADKRHYPLYLEKALQLSRIGTLILTDNLIPKDEEINQPELGNLETKRVYQFNEEVAKHPRVESILAPTLVGNEGRIDALGIAIVVR